MCGKWQGWHESVCGTGFSEHPAVWETEGQRKLVNLLMPRCYGMWTCGFQRKDNERCTHTVVLGTSTALSLDAQSLQALPDIPYFSMVWRSSCSLLGCLDAKLERPKARCSFVQPVKEVGTLFPATTGVQGSPEVLYCNLCSCKWLFQKVKRKLNYHAQFLCHFILSGFFSQ